MVETAGLENRCARKGTVGSNPTLSVTLPPMAVKAAPTKNSNRASVDGRVKMQLGGKRRQGDQSPLLHRRDSLH